MANFLTTLVDKTKRLLTKDETIGLATLHHYLRTAQINARNAKRSIRDNTPVFEYIHEGLMEDNVQGLSSVDKDLQKSYRNLLRQKPWARHVSRKQTMGKFHVFEKAFQTADRDLDWIISNLDSYFPKDEKSFSFRDLTVAQAYVLSYASNVNTTISWFQYLTYNFRLPSTSFTYKYQIKYIRENVELVETLLMDNITSVSSRKSVFQAELEKIVKDGKNMQILVDDQSIDKFASKNDFSSGMSAQMNGFINIPVLVGDGVLFVQRMISDHRESTVEWMNTRIAVIAMDMQELDPESSEYKRLENIMNHYSKEVADYEEKINKSKED